MSASMQPSPPSAISTQIKPVQILGGVVAFAGLVLGLASFVPFYKIQLFGISAYTIGGWEGFGDTEFWIAGVPAGFLLAAAGMVLIVAGAVLIWDAKPSYSNLAAVVATAVPFGIWAVVMGNFAFAVQQLDKASAETTGSAEELFGGLSTGSSASSSASDLLHPGTGWWVAGLVAWLALIGGIGAMVVLFRKTGDRSQRRSTAPASRAVSVLPPPPANGQPSTTRPVAPPPPLATATDQLGAF